MECPCKDCITLPICRGLVCTDTMRFLLNIEKKCSLYSEYVITKHTSTRIHINEAHAVETGKYLGFTISNVGPHQKRVVRIPLDVDN
jgi:hypothetical protein